MFSFVVPGTSLLRPFSHCFLFCSHVEDGQAPYARPVKVHAVLNIVILKENINNAATLANVQKVHNVLAPIPTVLHRQQKQTKLSAIWAHKSAGAAPVLARFVINIILKNAFLPLNAALKLTKCVRLPVRYLESRIHASVHRKLKLCLGFRDLSSGLARRVMIFKVIVMFFSAVVPSMLKDRWRD